MCGKEYQKLLRKLNKGKVKRNKDMVKNRNKQRGLSPKQAENYASWVLSQVELIESINYNDYTPEYK